MKVNGSQGEYLPVSQGVQSDEDETHLAITKGSVNAVPIKNGALESTLVSKDLEEAKSGAKSEKAPMSPLRKVCFVLSLLQCALFIIAFGWLIPCKLPRYLENPAKNWEFSLQSFDIVTSFGFAKLEKKSGLIIFGYQSPINASVHGVVSLNALDGSRAWEMSLSDSPASLVCDSNFQTSVHGPIMCLAVDKSGRMASFRASDGHIEWYVHNHNTSFAPSQLSVPSIGPDCDNDTVDEIFVAGVEESGNILYIVSGSSGQVLKTVALTTCTSVPKKIISWFFENQQHLIFSCMDKTGFENVWSVPIDNICGKTFNGADSIPFDSLDTRTLHSLEKGNSLLDILSIPVKSSNDYHQILVTKNGHIIQLLNYDNETAWTYDLPADLVLIDSTSGRFLNESSQYIAVLAKDSIDPKKTTLILIDEGSGQLSFNYTFINQTATFIYTISNGENFKDGLLVRTISPAVEDKEIKSEDSVVKDGSKAVSVNQILTVEEKFLILECDKNNAFTALLVIPQSTKCGSDGCKPDLYTTNPSVLLADVDGDGITELVQTVTAQSNNLDTNDIGNNIKLSRLSTAPSSCGSCSCS